jgi:heme oxygenase
LNNDPALNELRLTTRTEHERIEDILRLTEPMTLARYATIISGFDAFLRAWEPRIHDALPARLQQWFRTRRRGGLASADVDWLRSEAGLPPVAMNASAVAQLPLEHLPQLLGSLYVIEGSALGGRVIAPHLKASLGIGPGHGASYFHGFGGDTGEMWRDFRVLTSLEIGESSKDTVSACRSAKRTFAALIELFSPLAPLPELALDPAPDDAPAPPPSAFAARLASAGSAAAPTKDDTIVDLR